jgi:putative FmdB family regulatory protein
MPTYDYECGRCYHTFDVVQKIKAKPKKKCPKCNKFSLYRLIGPTQFVLKGAGWFSDGYSNTPSKKEQ